ncbi:MAG: IS66 family insertion sequence element accessory protein TnpA [Chlamydiales bacterium]
MPKSQYSRRLEWIHKIERWKQSGKTAWAWCRENQVVYTTFIGWCRRLEIQTAKANPQPHLKNYSKHAYARMDNNVAKRTVRSLALGRKNWLFVGNEDGGEPAAILFSLIQTCRALEINPRDYLEDVMRRLISHNSQKIHELLPDQWKTHQNSISCQDGPI